MFSGPATGRLYTPICRDSWQCDTLRKRAADGRFRGFRGYFIGCSHF